MTSLNINAERLLERLQWFSRNTRIPGTEHGVSALAMSDEEFDARIDLIEYEEKVLGLTVKVDLLATVFGFRPDRNGNIEGKAVGMISHGDTVQKGGYLDGIYGVLGACEAIHTMNDQNVQTDFPVVVIATDNEEGVKFKAMNNMWAFITGDYKSAILERSHLQGYDATIPERLKVFREKLAAAHKAGRISRDFATPDVIDPNILRALFELHVEQSTTLMDRNILVAAATGGVGIDQLNMEITAENPLHTGLAAFGINGCLRHIANEFDADQSTTVGTMVTKESIPCPLEDADYYHITATGVSGHAGGLVMKKRKDPGVAVHEILRAMEKVQPQYPGTRIVIGDIELGVNKDGKIEGQTNSVPEYTAFTIGIEGTPEAKLRLSRVMDSAISALEDPKGEKIRSLITPGEGVKITRQSVDGIKEVPTRIYMTADMRNSTNKLIEEAEGMLQEYFKALTKQGITIVANRQQRTSPPETDPQILDIIGDAMSERDLPVRYVITRAGHDSHVANYADPKTMRNIKERIPAGMVIVQDNGESHNPNEDAPREAITEGCAVLLNAVVKAASAKTELHAPTDPAPLSHDKTKWRQYTGKKSDADISPQSFQLPDFLERGSRRL